VLIFKPVTSEKAVRMIEGENTLLFALGDRRVTKEKIKKEFEQVFKARVEKINTMMKKNKKYAYITLNKENPAIDIATKLGMI